MQDKKIAYAVIHKDENVRAQSRSGGVFTALSDAVLEQNGVIYGCSLDENFTAHHTRAETEEERNSFRGSKYIQSDTGDCYKLCGEDLASGRTVLFSGTPCQIDGLKCYIEAKKINAENLYTVDIICHSVASPKVWKKFVDWRSQGKKVDSVDFRDKESFGWAAHKETLTVEGEKMSSDYFAGIYANNYINSLCCHNCYYKSLNRAGDITIGDYWHINEQKSSFNDNKGVSLVIVNTDKGRALFEKCSDSICVEEHNLMESLQPALTENYAIPKEREKFFENADKMSFDKIVDKYLTDKESIILKIKMFIMKLIKR